ncbi:hypothetical protein H5410_030960 [Solanum commersonii]|uniref:Uncharacterized protein n=1 Tax=Solanum commersonii TaxID=4109 RepID=A0A9J5YKV7_SOLCO|nr:hypothetical protein H5410_030960 [Solanum commersonii]
MNFVANNTITESKFEPPKSKNWSKLKKLILLKESIETATGWSHNYTHKSATNGKKNYRLNHHAMGRPGSPQEKTWKDQKYQPKAQNKPTYKKNKKTIFTIIYINKGNTSTNKTKDDLNEEQLDKVEENIVERFRREKDRAKPQGTNNTTTHGK